MLAFPEIDPIALAIGPVAIRWYALAYLAGFMLGWWYAVSLVPKFTFGVTRKHLDDYLTWAVIGTILGGRLGYVLFYNAEYYSQHPLEILQVWHGGMAFHGGMLGVIAAAWVYTRRQNLSFFAFTDILACVTPIGLFFGRLANFVNGELYGRTSDMPWAVVFPRGGELPRHPSQLYEAGLEGILLFIALLILARQQAVRARAGVLSGAFLFCYGLFRCVVELFREPDAQLGFLLSEITMGQLLCVPMMMFGLYLIVRSERRLKKRAA